MAQRAGAARGLRLARVLVVPVVALLALAGGTGTAQAHAELEQSDPVPGAVLPTQPAAVTLTFDDPVELRDSAIEVDDDRSRPVRVGPPTLASGRRDTVRVSLPAGLHGGTYTVRWSATADDAHPVQGSFRFSVGAPSTVHGSVPSARNDAAGALLGPLRWLGYLGLVLGPGLLVVALWIWPAALAQPNVHRLATAGLVALGVSTLGGMLLQGLWASGRPLSAVWTDPGGLDTHSHRFDQVYALRAYLLVALAAVLAACRTAGRVPRRLLLLAAVLVMLGLAATWPPAGHAAAGASPWFPLLVDLLHLLAVTLWLGGLALLLVGLSGGRPGTLAAVLPRFSRVALSCVATLVVTGTTMAWREVGSLGALTSTTFGRVLLVKVAAVAVLLLLGDAGRRWVRRGHPALGERLRDPGARARLRRGVRLEVGTAAGVLAATAALVVLVPAEQAAAPRGSAAPAAAARG